MSFGRSRARLLGEDQVKITFADVAGVEEAKDEVRELVEFLRDPVDYNRIHRVESSHSYSRFCGPVAAIHS